MGELYEATLQFIAETDTELSLQVGDRVTVTDRNDQWWYGSLRGQQGWFPADHVKPAQPVNNRGTPSGGPPPPPTKPKNPTPKFGGYNTNNNVVSHSSPGPGAGSVGPPGRSAFADNLRNIQNQLGGPAAPPPSSNIPQDGRRGPNQGYRQSSVEVPSPTTPSFGGSSENGRMSYADSGYNSSGSNGYNTQPRANTPLRPPNIAQLNIRPPGSNGGPGLPRNSPPTNQYPSNRRHSVPSTPPASPGINKANYSFQFCVEAQHPYSAQTNDQLTFAAREKLDVIERPSPSSDWWRARNKAGEIGLVPMNYVKEIPQSKPVLAERLWYLPGIRRDETEQRMRRQPTECFVIRDSEAFPGSFTLSVKGPDKVRHIKVSTVTDGYHVGDKKFHSLDAVVDFYRNSPIYIADDGSYKLLLCRALGNSRT